MYYTSVRFGKMMIVALFKSDSSEFRVRDRCVLKTERGIELGTILKKPDSMPESIPPESLGNIIRRFNSDDQLQLEKIESDEKREIQFCQETIKKLGLPMKVTSVDHLFGGGKVVFYFTAENRVDFRELVKILAQEFKMRIELKQIGARDAAKLCGGVGHCGLQLCCGGFLRELGGISMEMAKLQKHTADPSKITGLCGKLLCCLRYEFQNYVDAHREKGEKVGEEIKPENEQKVETVE